MRCTRIDHIALSVESVRQAENLYSRLFDMRVLYRDAAVDGATQRITADAKSLSNAEQWPVPWNEGAVVQRSCLEGDGLRLVLMRRTEALDPHGRLDHVCLRIDDGDLPRLARLAGELGCQVTESGPGCLIIVDPYGVSWTLRVDDAGI